MHSLVVKIIFPHACLDEGFDILVGIPSLDKVIISFLHHGLSQALVLNLFISKLVNLFASSVCVWEGYVLHFVLISSRLY